MALVIACAAGQGDVSSSFVRRAKPDRVRQLRAGQVPPTAIRRGFLEGGAAGTYALYTHPARMDVNPGDPTQPSAAGQDRLTAPDPPTQTQQKAPAACWGGADLSGAPSPPSNSQPPHVSKVIADFISHSLTRSKQPGVAGCCSHDTTRSIASRGHFWPNHGGRNKRRPSALTVGTNSIDDFKNGGCIHFLIWSKCSRASAAGGRLPVPWHAALARTVVSMPPPAEEISWRPGQGHRLRSGPAILF